MCHLLIFVSIAIWHFMMHHMPSLNFHMNRHFCAICCVIVSASFLYVTIFVYVNFHIFQTLSRTLCVIVVLISKKCHDKTNAIVWEMFYVWFSQLYFFQSWLTKRVLLLQSYIVFLIFVSTDKSDNAMKKYSFFPLCRNKIFFNVITDYEVNCYEIVLQDWHNVSISTVFERCVSCNSVTIVGDCLFTSLIQNYGCLF